jgi:hypothetical protein
MDKLDDDCGSNPTRTPHPGQAEQVAAQPPTMDVMGGKKKKTKFNPLNIYIYIFSEPV